MSKIAYFDFCETLIKFQTADLFIDFVRKENKDQTMKLLEYVRRFLVRLKFFAFISLFYKNNFHKRLKLFQLRGQKKKLLELYADRYYQEILKPNIISEVFDQMVELKKRGYSIVVVSGGYSIYIKKFVEDFSLDYAISTRIDFDKYGLCKGLIDGYDCLGNNKVALLENSQFQKSDKDETIAFSDNVSDLPLLNFADKGVVISKNKGQKWAETYGFSEIIWTGK